MRKCDFHSEALDVQDYGDVEIAHRAYSPDFPRNMRNYAQIVGTCRNLARYTSTTSSLGASIFTFSTSTFSKVEEVLKDGRIVVTLGGDHSVGIGEFNLITI